jgi:hypothetical protein
MNKELAHALNETAESIYGARKNVGKCPQWYRRRDARNEVLNRFTGNKVSDRTMRRVTFVCPQRGSDAR